MLQLQISVFLHGAGSYSDLSLWDSLASARVDAAAAVAVAAAGSD